MTRLEEFGGKGRGKIAQNGLLQCSLMLWPHIFSLDFISSSRILRLRWNCHLWGVWVESGCRQSYMHNHYMNKYYKKMPLIWSAFMTLFLHISIWTHASVYVSEARQFSLCMYKHTFAHIHKSDIGRYRSFLMWQFQYSNCIYAQGCSYIHRPACLHPCACLNTVPPKVLLVCREPKANGSSAEQLISYCGVS